MFAQEFVAALFLCLDGIDAELHNLCYIVPAVSLQAE